MPETQVCRCIPPCLPVGKHICRRLDAFRVALDALLTLDLLLKEYTEPGHLSRLWLQELWRSIEELEVYADEPSS